MNKPLIRILGIFSLSFSVIAHAGTLYVDLNCTNPTPPYSNWSTAATNIQNAIDVSTDGDLIWVTNGVYQAGGKVMAGNLTNRVTLDKAVTVQSVNGPFVTTIAGIGTTNSIIAVRCAWLTNNAALVGFTLTRGNTRGSGDTVSLESGGAIWCASSNALVSNCVIVSNAAFFRGGGAYQGRLNNCFIANNSAPFNPTGGAAYSALLNNCTVVSNSSVGLTSCKATNSICYYNGGNNYSGGSFSYSCVTPTAAGTGNFTNAPIFFPDRIHLASGSPGVGVGTTPITSTDIFGQTWESPPSVGCAETGGLPYVFPPQVQSTNNPIGFAIKSAAFGDPPFIYTWLRNGVPLQDDSHFSGTQSPNLTATGVSFADGGNYQFVASNNSGSVTSAVARVIIHCVDNAGSNPMAPYATWETAATNIQDAIDAAAAGEFVLVTNGVYSTGGKAIDGDLTNRVAIDKALIVISVNGYMSTVIEGQWDPTSTNGPGAVRCAWLTDGATLFGFTLRNGATRGVNTPTFQYGGGALLSDNALLSNCTVTNNSAHYAGGGVAFGQVNNCYIGNNSALQQGGGAYSCHLNNCTVRLNYCLFSGNGGGVNACVSRNCIVAENYRLPNDADVDNYSLHTVTDIFTNCWTTPLPSRGDKNITNAPLFLNFPDGFALSPASPCRGAGNPLFTTGYDLDGEPYLNPPSIGCDEIITSNLSGPLSFRFLFPETNTVTIVNHRVFLAITVQGRPSELDWSFGDGPAVTNLAAYASHTWTNTGTYNVTLTAYNLDHPSGVTTNLTVTIVPLLVPTLQSVGTVSNAFQFSVPIQAYGSYFVEYTTNITPPVVWQQLTFLLSSTTDTVRTVRDPAITNNGSRFYRVTAH